MPTRSSELPRTLIIQLARLGDLLQSLPVISALRLRFPQTSLDLLCPSPLAPLGAIFPAIQQTISWNGEEWHAVAKGWNGILNQSLPQAIEYFSRFPSTQYAVAYNLNNHPRSILASHLLSARVVGAGAQGPLNPTCPPWVEYLKQVVCERGTNRIHLADAFCGLCGVRPPTVLPIIQATDIELSPDLAQIANDSSFVRIGIVLGAGDADRRVPIATLCRLLESCIDLLPNCLCLVIGGAGEREAALALEDQLAPQYLSRLLNCVGRTTLPQLAHVFNQCQWVVGSDTGPLHLAVACGARAIGWYFSRARVHETGPYGVGHYVLQHRGHGHPGSWPVMETIQLMRHEQVDSCSTDWDLWTSHRDEWGMLYKQNGKQDHAIFEREETWERLSELSSEHSLSLMPPDKVAG